MPEASWRFDPTCGWWECSDGRVITEAAIAIDPTLHPHYEPPKPQPTFGEQVLGFAYGSAEAKRQRLEGALYYHAVDATVRAQRDVGPPSIESVDLQRKARSLKLVKHYTIIAGVLALALFLAFGPHSCSVVHADSNEHADALVSAILIVDPSLPPERVIAAVQAITAEHGRHDPLLVTALFLGETTHLDPAAVNPNTGACGIGQVLYSKDRQRQARRCRRIVGDVVVGTRAAIQKLQDGVDFCRRRTSGRRAPVDCWIAAYRGGPDGVRAWEDGSRLMRNAVRATLKRRDALLEALNGTGRHHVPGES